MSNGTSNQLDLDLDEPLPRPSNPFLERLWERRLGLSAAEIHAVIPDVRFERHVGADLVQALLEDIPALAALRGVDRLTVEKRIEEEFDQAMNILRWRFFPDDDPDPGEKHPDPGESVVIPFPPEA